jgi:hypothetical protein
MKHFVHIDHLRAQMARREQCILEEAFGRSGVTSGAQEEVDGGTDRIHRSK